MCHKKYKWHNRVCYFKVISGKKQTTVSLTWIVKLVRFDLVRIKLSKNKGWLIKQNKQKTLLLIWKTLLLIWKTLLFIWKTLGFIWKTLLFIWKTLLFSWKTLLLIWKTFLFIWKSCFLSGKRWNLAEKVVIYLKTVVIW